MTPERKTGAEGNDAGRRPRRRSRGRRGARPGDTAQGRARSGNADERRERRAPPQPGDGQSNGSHTTDRRRSSGAQLDGPPERRRRNRRKERGRSGAQGSDPERDTRRGKGRSSEDRDGLRARSRESGAGSYVYEALIDPERYDRDADRVVSRLQRSGHEAYFVGGCVRDLLIGRTPKDFDVATSAHPSEIRRAFRNGRIIGRRFKLVHIYYGDNIIETATFRSDPGSEGRDLDDEDLLILEDNEFGTAAEDARRRDFTVNGLFLDPTAGEIIDYVDGMRDLEDRVLRTIGDPFVRLAEDPVRILRAIKFATRLDFSIDPQTEEAMIALAPQLERSAPPRVLEEILRLLRSRCALGAFRSLRRYDALEVLMPELDEFLSQPGDEDAGAEHFWRLLEALDDWVSRGYEPSTALLIAILFLDLVEFESDPETRTQPGEPPLDLGDVAQEVIEPLAATTRLSRREFSRARRMLTLQPQFEAPHAERFSPLLFAHSEEFSEAFDLFRMRVRARGQGSDIVDAWKSWRSAAVNASEEELDAERRKTRRRRGKRRRRRKSRGRRSGS